MIFFLFLFISPIREIHNLHDYEEDPRIMGLVEKVMGGIMKETISKEIFRMSKKVKRLENIQKIGIENIPEYFYRPKEDDGHKSQNKYISSYSNSPKYSRLRNRIKKRTRYK